MAAASFSGSALDMEKFAESMKVLAPVAKSAGFEIEDTTALIGTLAIESTVFQLADSSFSVDPYDSVLVEIIFNPFLALFRS